MQRKLKDSGYLGSDVLRARLASFLEELRQDKKLSESTCRQYERELTKLLELIELPLRSPFDGRSEPRKSSEIEGSTFQIAEELARNCLRGSQSSTSRRKLIIWRQFLKTCPTPWPDFLASAPKPKIRKKNPRFLTEEESFRLEAASYRSKDSTRDRLFLGFGLQLGLRLSELLQLRFSDISGEWIRLIRKGEKEQILPLTKSLQALIEHWKRERKPSSQDYIFEGKTGGPLSARGAQKLLDRLATLAKLEKKISPHALRHSFASRLAANGASLVAIKELLGHQSLQTTERYLHVTPAHLKQSLKYLKNLDPRGT